MSFSMDSIPNGVMIILDPESGQWQMSVNRVQRSVVTSEMYAEMFSEAKQWLREARDNGLPVVDPDDDDSIIERLPKVGDFAPTSLESVSRTLDGGLEEAASILPNLWGWIVGIDDEPWEPTNEE